MRDGVMRDVVRQLQEIRKEMRLPYDARIQVTLHSADPGLPGIVDEFRDAIAGEILAESIAFADTAPADARTFTIDDQTVSAVVTVAEGKK